MIVGDAHVLTGDDAWLRDSQWGQRSPCLARAIVRPFDTGELSRVMAACHAAGQIVVVHGGLTNMTGATTTEKSDVAVSLERFTAIERCDPLERTAYVQAGVTIHALQEAAEGMDLLFPVDFGARGSATVGGAISTNAGGNRVFRFGAMREQVLGLEIVLADGTIVDAMRGLVKDNSGYDIKQLFIGSEGTLGIVTRACVRLRSRPRSSSTALIATDQFVKVQKLLRHVEEDLGGQLTTFEVLWRDYYAATVAQLANRPLAPGAAFYVLLEAEGHDPEIDSGQFRRTLERAIEAGLIDDAVEAKSQVERLSLFAIRDDIDAVFRLGTHLDFDVSVSLADMERYSEAVSRSLRVLDSEIRAFVFGHIADGNIHFIVSRPEGFSSKLAKAVKELVYRPLQQLNGSISAEHGIGFEKRDYLSITRRAEEIACMRVLKCAFDPTGILNPGRVLLSDRAADRISMEQ